MIDIENDKNIQKLVIATSKAFQLVKVKDAEDVKTMVGCFIGVMVKMGYTEEDIVPFSLAILNNWEELNEMANSDE